MRIRKIVDERVSHAKADEIPDKSANVTYFWEGIDER
jgi:hypothetical protein